MTPRSVVADTVAVTNAATSPDGPVLEGRMRVIGFALFALIMSINGFVLGVISLQLVPLLEAACLVGTTAVCVASPKGQRGRGLGDEHCAEGQDQAGADADRQLRAGSRGGHVLQPDDQRERIDLAYVPATLRLSEVVRINVNGAGCGTARSIATM